MKKKFIGILLVLVMLSTATAAFGATASKTTKDLVKIVSAVSADGVSEDALLWVKETPSDIATKQLTDISAFVAQNNPVIDYFAEDVKTQVAALLPEGTDAAQLTMSEFMDLGMGEYEESIGDVTSTFAFATEFLATQKVIVMVGYTDADGNTVWQALPATVVDGMIQVTFPAELLLKAGNDIVLAVLSA